jgi:hypothetical protein
VSRPTHLEINFKANSVSPLKRTKNALGWAFNPFQWVLAISLEIDFKAGAANHRSPQ